VIPRELPARHQAKIARRHDPDVGPLTCTLKDAEAARNTCALRLVHSFQAGQQGWFDRVLRIACTSYSRAYARSAGRYERLWCAITNGLPGSASAVKVPVRFSSASTRMVSASMPTEMVRWLRARTEMR
jgi:hypothetical protein